MQHFQKIADGIDVSEAIAELDRQPDLWNVHAGRTDESSPHYGVDDIWLRYRALAELVSPEKFLEPHFAVFYPAWRRLPALRPIVFSLMAKAQATYLGGLLITRIKPGGRVKPHHDRGSWHAETMNCKLYVPLRANEKCVNYCEDESIVIKPGEAVSFNNQLMHSVENNGDTERVTLIVCMRVEH